MSQSNINQVQQQDQASEAPQAGDVVSLSADATPLAAEQSLEQLRTIAAQTDPVPVTAVNRQKRKREDDDADPSKVIDDADGTPAERSYHVTAKPAAIAIAAEMEDFIEADDDDIEEAYAGNSGESEFEPPSDDDESDEEDHEIPSEAAASDYDRPPTPTKKKRAAPASAKGGAQEEEEEYDSKEEDSEEWDDDEGDGEAVKTICDLNPSNIISEERPKRQRRGVNRYVDESFGKLMFADVPPEEIEKVFDDKDPWFDRPFKDTGVESASESGSDEEEDIGVANDSMQVDA